MGGMSDVLSKIGEGLWNSVLMAYAVWWALVLGFAISAIVQAWVPAAPGSARRQDVGPVGQSRAASSALRSSAGPRWPRSSRWP
jgi:hypothetical protein